MTLGQTLLTLTLIAGISAGIPIWLRGARQTVEVRGLLALAPLAALLSLVVLFVRIAENPEQADGPARLASSVALLEGEDLYPANGSGPLLGNSSGPVAALFSLPAALVPGYRASLLVASTLNLLAVITGVLIVFLHRTRGQRALAIAFAAFTLAALCGTESGLQVLSRVGPYGVALSLLVISSTTLLRRGGEPSARRLSVGAVGMALAAWSNAVVIPAAFGQLCWLLISFGRPAAMRYGLSLALFAVLSTAIFGSVFGFDAVLLNLVTVPGAVEHTSTASMLWEGLLIQLPFLVILAWVYLGSRREARRKHPLEGDWGLFLLVGLFLLPTTSKAHAALGTFATPHTSTLLFVLAAGLALRGSLHPPSARSLRLERVRPLVVLALALATLPLLPFDRVLGFEPGEGDPVIDLSKAHPHEILYPTNPLATYHTEGRLYHQELGVYGRRAAGLEPTQTEIGAHLPESLRYVVYPIDAVGAGGAEGAVGRETMIQYLPEFSERTEHGEWLVYHRPGDDLP